MIILRLKLLNNRLRNLLILTSLIKMKHYLLKTKCWMIRTKNKFKCAHCPILNMPIQDEGKMGKNKMGVKISWYRDLSIYAWNKYYSCIHWLSATFIHIDTYMHVLQIYQLHKLGMRTLHECLSFFIPVVQ